MWILLHAQVLKHVGCLTAILIYCGFLWVSCAPETYYTVYVGSHSSVT